MWSLGARCSLCSREAVPVITLYGTRDFPHLDGYDLSGSPGFTGTAVPRSMFDGDNDAWFGVVGESHLARLPVPPGRSRCVARP